MTGVSGGIANGADGAGDVHLDRSTEARSSLKPDGGGSPMFTTSLNHGNRHLGLRSIAPKDASHSAEELAHRYNLMYAPKVWTMSDETLVGSVGRCKQAAMGMYWGS